MRRPPKLTTEHYVRFGDEYVHVDRGQPVLAPVEPSRYEEHMALKITPIESPSSNFRPNTVWICKTLARLHDSSTAGAPVRPFGARYRRCSIG